jgi:hypothetical protein
LSATLTNLNKKGLATQLNQAIEATCKSIKGSSSNQGGEIAPGTQPRNDVSTPTPEPTPVVPAPRKKATTQAPAPKVVKPKKDRKNQNKKSKK